MVPMVIGLAILRHLDRGTGGDLVRSRTKRK